MAGAAGLVLPGVGIQGRGDADAGTGRVDWASTASTAHAGQGSPRALTVDGLASPIGLALDDIYFGWHLGDARRGAVQSAYRIVVSWMRPAGIGRSNGSSLPVVWDSGKVKSTQQAFVAYRGPTLAPDSVYRWTVQSWPATGGPSAFAPPATFETGVRDRK